jgi:hypothetical protein
MVANTFDNRIHSRISDTETFTCLASDVRLTGCSPIKCYVTDNDIVFRLKSALFVWVND